VLSRRRFIHASGGLLTLPSFLDARALADTSKFYFAIIADTHIIDEFYKGPESNPEDTESMFKTRERLISARDTINALQPAMEEVFLVGEYSERADYGLLPLLEKHRETVQRVISGHWHRWFEFGRSYGPQHLVMAATRYDENAYLIVEADTRAVSHQLLNLDLVDWNTHFSKPYRKSRS
jgi:hypothetical protein